MKKYITYIAAGVAALGLFSSALVAGAQTTTDQSGIGASTTSSAPGLYVGPSVPSTPTVAPNTGSETVPGTVTSTPTQPTISVDETGNVLLRGTVQGAGTGTLTLASWGGNWTIDTNPTTQIVPVASDTSAMNTGDFVGVAGTIDQNQPWTIDASVVHDWTETSDVTNAQRSGTSASMTATTTSNENLYTGTVSAMSASGFTLTDSNGNTYLVGPTAQTLVWDNNRGVMSFSNIQNSDSVRIDGTVNIGVLTPSVIRDTSR